MKRLTPLGWVAAGALLVLVLAGANYNLTARVVDSLGNVLDGAVASATVATYKTTIRIVDSAGNVIDSFGLASVTHDGTLSGLGTSGSPIGLSGKLPDSSPTSTANGTLAQFSVNGVINPMAPQFGVLCDGTDETTKVQTAMTAAVAVTSGVLEFPPNCRTLSTGQINITGPVTIRMHDLTWTSTAATLLNDTTTDGVRIQGDGEGRSILKQGASTGGSFTGLISFSKAMPGIAKVYISDITLDGNRTNNASTSYIGILGVRVGDATIERVELTGFQGDAIRFNPGLGRVVLRQNYVWNSGTAGISAGHGINVTHSASGNSDVAAQITNNFVDTTATGAECIKFSIGNTNNIVDGPLIADNTCWLGVNGQGTWGIEVFGFTATNVLSRATVRDNWIIGAKRLTDVVTNTSTAITSATGFDNYYDTAATIVLRGQGASASDLVTQLMSVSSCTGVSTCTSGTIGLATSTTASNVIADVLAGTSTLQSGISVADVEGAIVHHNHLRDIHGIGIECAGCSRNTIDGNDLLHCGNSTINSGGYTPNGGVTIGNLWANNRFIEGTDAVNGDIQFIGSTTTGARDTKLTGNLFDQSAGSALRWNCSEGPDWVASTAYAAGKILRPTSQNTGSYIYEAAGACTSGGSRPTPFNQTLSSATADNTCSWINIGLDGPFGCSDFDVEANTFIGSRTMRDATTSSTTVTSATANFRSTDVGKAAYLEDPAGVVAAFRTTIASISDSSNAVLTAAPGAAFTTAAILRVGSNTHAISGLTVRGDSILNNQFSYWVGSSASGINLDSNSASNRIGPNTYIGNTADVTDSGLNNYFPVPATITTATSTATIKSSTAEEICNKGTAMSVNFPTGGMLLGQPLAIKNIGAGACTADSLAGNLIDAAQTFVLNQYDAISLKCRTVTTTSGLTTCTQWDIQ